MRSLPLLSVALLLGTPAAPAAPLDLPDRPGVFWLRLDTLPERPQPVDPVVDEQHFNSLAALTEYALRNRPESRAAWLGIQAEAARLDAASAANWPTLTAQFSFTRSRSLSSSGASVPTLHRYGPSLALSYVIYDFGARAAGIDAQRYQLIAALLGSNRSLQDIMAEVETAYFAVLAARAQGEAARAQETALARSLDAVNVRLQGGLASRADQLRARAAHVEATLARQATERDLAKAEAALKQAAAIPQTRRLVLDWDTPAPTAPESGALLADLIDEAVRQRPDLLALQASVARARAEADRARAERWPTVSLAASTGRTAFLEEGRSASTTYTVGVNISVPIFDGGRLAATARAAERDADRLQAQVAGQQAIVERDVADAYYDARHAQLTRQAIDAQFDSASESAQAAEARYTAGVGSLLEWLTAQADLARARQAVAQANVDWYAAFARLNHALGRLPSPPTRPTPP